MDSTVVVLADLTAKPENADQFGAALRELEAACRTEPGCLRYDTFRSTDRPERFVSVETFADTAAFDAHRSAEHFARIGIGTVMPLVETSDVQVFAGERKGSTVWVVSDCTAEPENADALRAAIQKLAVARRTEPDCLAYDIFRREEQPERFLILEKYTDAIALNEHRAAERFTRIAFSEIAPLIETRNVQEFTGSTSTPTSG